MYCPPSKTIKLRCSCVDPLYVISMCEATSCAHPIDSILCGSTVLQVSSNYLSPDSADPLYLACLCYVTCIIDQIELWQHGSLVLDMHLWSFMHFPWTLHVHVLISTSVWIYFTESSPGGTGPVYATWHCNVTCIVHQKQSNWDWAVWIHCMWYLCEATAIWIQSTPSCVDPLRFHCAASQFELIESR